VATSLTHGGRPDGPSVAKNPVYLTNRLAVHRINEYRGYSPDWKRWQIQGCRDDANIYLCLEQFYLQHGWSDAFQRQKFKNEVNAIREGYAVLQEVVIELPSSVQPEHSPERRQAIENAQAEMSEYFRTVVGAKAVT
jgi:hypothetical protein